MQRVFLALTIGAILVAGYAAAQDGGAIIDRDRIDRRTPDVETPAPAEPERGRQQGALASIAPFVLRDVRVEGSSLPRSAFEAVIDPLRGQSFDGGSLATITDALSRAYAESNVALYTILTPEQNFTDGVVVLQVIEGHVSRVALQGDTSGDITLARHYAAALTYERPLSRATMERAMLLLSDIPGLRTEVRMAPAADAGGVNAGLELRRRRFETAIDVNNRGSNTLGRTQLQASAALNALFRLGDQTRLVLASDSQFERFTYVALSHRQALGYDGAAVQGRVSMLDTSPSNSASGEARAAGLVITYPAIRSYRRNLTLSAGLDALNSDNAFLGDTIASERVRALRAAAAYSATHRRRTARIAGTLSAGLDAWGARASDPTTAIDFTKLNLQLGYARPLGARWVIRAAGAGQLTDDPLPASERITFGGASFGRAFDAAEIAGDDGLGASAELAWRTLGDDAFFSELYGFADGGRTWREDRGATPGVTNDIVSAGLGARLRLGETTALELEAAQAVEAPAAADEGEWLLRWGLNARF